MGSTYIVCCVLAIALNQHVVVEGAVCANDITRASCSWDAVVLTQAACNGLAGGCCNWCLTPTPMPITRRCQTDNFACLVVSPTIISTGTTLALCTAAGGIYCTGDTSTKCINDEPLLKLCYKPGGPDFSCPTTYATQSACDLSGTCFWCAQGINKRINKCWAKPAGAATATTASTATTATATGEKLTCASTGRFPCLWDTGSISTTMADCNAVAGGCCRWCTTPSPMPHKKKCQTGDLSCVVPTHKIFTQTFATAALCEAAGGVYCGGDTTQKCVCDEPNLKLCYRPAAVPACPTTHATQALCDADALCFWCVLGIVNKKAKCWAKPGAAVSCKTGTCCDKLNCASTVTAPTCDVSYKPCIWDDVTTTSMTEQRCHESNKHCAWCPDQATIRGKCQTVDRSCLVADRWSISAATKSLCSDAGGVYCHGDCAKCCIYPEPADKICFKPGWRIGCATAATTTDPVVCRTAGCVWCDGTGVIVRQNKCWAMPAGAMCASGTCCREHRCMDGLNNPLTACTAMGCVTCFPTGIADSFCVYQ